MILAAAAISIPSGLLSIPSQCLATESMPNLSASELARIKEIVREFMEEFHVPGFSVAIARQGKFVLREGFGFADLAAREELTASHLFRIASISKPVTSAAIFYLIEKKKLKLDDFIFGERGLLKSDYGSEFPGQVKDITVHHLLTHTGGGWTNDGEDPMFRHPKMDHRELIAWTLKNQPLKNPPGEHYAYSNFGYCVLGRVIEKLTDQSYPAFVRGNILAKCGVTGMVIAGNQRSERERNEVVYEGQNGENPYNMNVRRMDSHGGWIGTPSDLVQFALHVDGFKAKPDILGDSSVKIMTTPTAANGGYACGWAVNKSQNWWHGGSLPGTATILARISNGLCWAGFINTRTKGTDRALDEVMWKIAKAVPTWNA